MRFLSIVAVFLLLLGGHVNAAPHRCDDAVAARMSELKVSPAQTVRTVIVTVTDGGCCEQFAYYEAWVDLKQCQGSVVMKLSEQCGVDEIYTKGACKFEGLKNFR